jgi:DNA repair protein RecO (recombination protein O)
MSAIIADDTAGEVAMQPTVVEDELIAVIGEAGGAAASSPPKRRARPLDTRVTGQPGFVLHSYPHRETSLIIDVFSRDYGRIALVAKGAKRPLSKLRGVLQTFQPLSLSWSGKSEIRTLIAAEG